MTETITPIERHNHAHNMYTLGLPKGTTLPARVLDTLELVKVNRVSEGQYGYCLDCGQILEPGPTKAWTFRSTQAMHERGMGHKTVMVALRAIS